MGAGRYGIFASRAGNPFKTLQFILYSNVISPPLWILTTFQLILSFTTLLEEQQYKSHVIKHSFDVIL